jgi:hypothetical protein
MHRLTAVSVAIGAHRPAGVSVSIPDAIHRAIVAA